MNMITRYEGEALRRRRSRTAGRYDREPIGIAEGLFFLFVAALSGAAAVLAWVQP